MADINNEHTAGEPMSIKMGLIMAVFLTIALCLFSMIVSSFGIEYGWAGYLFFWFWSSMRHFEMDNVKNDVINSIVGIALGWLSYWALNTYGIGGFNVVVMIVLLVVLFLLVTKLIPLLVGETTFMFYTVLTAHQFLTGANYVHIAIAYIAGVIFFLVVLGLFMKLLNTLAARKADIQ